MNIFSNLGITELVLILLFALLVVGPERLPELGRKLGTTLRDVRKAYDNLARDLGPEFSSLTETTRELTESLESVRSIPQDMVNTVVKAADLEDTIQELKDVGDSVGQIGQTLSSAEKTIKDPVGAAVSTARSALLPEKDKASEVADTAGTVGDGVTGEEGAEAQEGTVRAEVGDEAAPDTAATEAETEAQENTTSAEVGAEVEPDTGATEAGAEAKTGEAMAEAVAESVIGESTEEGVAVASDPEEQADD